MLVIDVSNYNFPAKLPLPSISSLDAACNVAGFGAPIIGNYSSLMMTGTAVIPIAVYIVESYQPPRSYLD